MTMPAIFSSAGPELLSSFRPAALLFPLSVVLAVPPPGTAPLAVPPPVPPKECSSLIMERIPPAKSPSLAKGIKYVSSSPVMAAVSKEPPWA
ncbi:hypothetical protein D3C81_1780990 [compost metagenome]